MSISNHYTEPQIINFNTLSKHAYIEFYFNGKRIRIANGDTLMQRIKPNRCQSIEERNQLLSELHFELKKALESNRYPVKQTSEAVVPQFTVVAKPIETNNHSTIDLLFKAVRSKLRDDLSKKYKRNLKSVYRQFKKFATADELEGTITSISKMRIESFLLQFSKTGTYYMNKRRDLGVLFSTAGRLIDQPVDIIQKSQKKKSKAKLHKTYDQAQLKPILSYLKTHNPNLYICSLLTYGAWLRPHEEIRLLTTGNFKNDLREVHLSGEENKGGRVRVVNIPEYIRVELRDKLANLGRNDNIFSLNAVPFNEYYFNTQWSSIGKSNIIYSIYEWIITTYCVKPITNATWPVDGGNEVRAVLDIGKLRIGIASPGDNVDEVDKNLDEFFKHDVDIIICACRTRGYSFDTVRNRLTYPSYVTNWCIPEWISPDIKVRVPIAIEELKALLIGLSK